MKIILFAAIAMVRGNFIGMKIISLHAIAMVRGLKYEISWMKIISFAAIAMVRGQNNEISFFGRERERGEGAGGTVPRSSKTSVYM